MKCTSTAAHFPWLWSGAASPQMTPPSPIIRQALYPLYIASLSTWEETKTSVCGGRQRGDMAWVYVCTHARRPSGRGDPKIRRRQNPFPSVCITHSQGLSASGIPLLLPMLRDISGSFTKSCQITGPNRDFPPFLPTPRRKGVCNKPTATSRPDRPTRRCRIPTSLRADSENIGCSMRQDQGGAAPGYEECSCVHASTRPG